MQETLQPPAADDCDQVRGYWRGWQVFESANGGSWLAYKPNVMEPRDVRFGGDLEELLRECERADTLPFPVACCRQAETFNCSCAFSWRCPEHYPHGIHHGTHD